MLLSRVYPVKLKNEMKRKLDFDVSSENNVRKFISTLHQEGINFYHYGLDKVNSEQKGNIKGKQNQGAG